MRRRGGRPTTWRGDSLVRQQAALRVAGDALCSCGHTMREHRELRATFYALENGVIVETPNPDYRPLAFHCHREGCTCVRDEAAAMTPVGS